ncbi:hypothetical protein GNI_031200 [Gregarina niphandrodes]|uniref:Protein kinase domain-containing protein n=1 Tax=Gregarina niphandrodes TaxID=110365 RepID=A0A023BAZ2_GRENI|nr:hypothetical protein GNI_031200 [Gregarina niphandrodes]EZG78929.1 hypothetical protein GNI_031200 [Gregarina niphandrodes]|eukprot:XP_011129163.1 hypothetical protein GNI_031200 [Gregarina niphandrodes]
MLNDRLVPGGTPQFRSPAYFSFRFMPEGGGRNQEKELMAGQEEDIYALGISLYLWYYGTLPHPDPANLDLVSTWDIVDVLRKELGLDEPLDGPQPVEATDGPVNKQLTTSDSLLLVAIRAKIVDIQEECHMVDSAGCENVFDQLIKIMVLLLTKKYPLNISIPIIRQAIAKFNKPGQDHPLM